MRHKKTLQILVDFLAIGIIIVTAVFFWNNKSYFAVPDPDLFQYISDSRQYLQFRLPQNIQTPPANPILLGVLARLLPSAAYPEIVAATIINIVAATMVLLFSYCLIRRYSRVVGLVTILLLSTNPQFLLNSLNSTSEVVFTACVVVVLFLYQTKRHTLAYVVAGLTFFVRFEAFLLLTSMTIIDLLRRRGTRKIARLAIFGLVPILLWTMIINRQNHQGNIFGNTYVTEVLNQQHRIPQMDLIIRLPMLLADKLSTDTTGPLHTTWILFLYAHILFGVYSFIKNSNHSMRLMCLYTVLYLFFHVFFPYAPDRYLYPVMWCLYVLFLQGLYSVYLFFFNSWHKFSYIVLSLYGVIGLFIVAGNLQKTIIYYNNMNTVNAVFPRNFRYEVRMGADWLNSVGFDKPVVVLTYDSGIMSPFVTNRLVSFMPSWPLNVYQQCDTILCVIKAFRVDVDQNDVLFIQQSNSTLADESFPSATNFNVKIFNQFPTISEKDDFVLIATLAKYDTWAKIYQYTPTQRNVIDPHR